MSLIIGKKVVYIDRVDSSRELYLKVLEDAGAEVLALASYNEHLVIKYEPFDLMCISCFRPSQNEAEIDIITQAVSKGYKVVVIHSGLENIRDMRNLFVNQKVTDVFERHYSPKLIIDEFEHCFESLEYREKNRSSFDRFDSQPN